MNLDKYSFARGYIGWWGLDHPRFSDRGFIAEQLSKIDSFQAKVKIMEKYSSEYDRIEKEDGAQAARTQCNTQLRVAVKNSKRPVKPEMKSKGNE